MSRRRLSLLVAALTVVASTPLTSLAGGPARAATLGGPTAGLPASGTIAPLGFLHVVTPASGADRTPYLADAAGRRVLLHGDAAVGLQDVAYPNADGGPALFPVTPASYDGTCPKASPLIPQPPLCEAQAGRPAYDQSTAPASGDDFAQMRALGFNVVRLVLNWSQLEPTPGHYSTTYLNRVAQVVGWAAQQGISVILDMHQDQYSRFIVPGNPKTLPKGCTPSGGGDGAPAWAVLTDGKPECALFGQGDLNPAEGAAFYNFWHNHPVAAPKGQAPGTGLEDHYIGALAALATRFEHDPAVLGYELMNEPQPGSLASLPVANLYQAAAQNLFPFYKRAVEALTGVRDGLSTCPASSPMSTDCAYPQLADVTHQQIFFEPIAYRNLVDFSPQVSAPFSTYPNLVWAPHTYTHAFTVDQFIGEPITGSPFPPSYEFGYQTAEAEAQAMHAAVLVTEFGDSASTDQAVLSGEMAAQEDTLTGGTVWAWKGLAQEASSCWCVRWQYSSYQTTANGTPGKGDPHSTPSPDDQLIPSRVEYLSRVFPEATAGSLLAYREDPSARTFAMLAADPTAVAPGDASAETVVSIPSTVHGTVAVSGQATLDDVVTEPDSSRLAYVAPTGSSGTATVPVLGTPAVGVLQSSASGTYAVTVGPASVSLRAGVAAEAAQPPQPISEVTARAITEHFLKEAEASTNPHIRANARLAATLAVLLFGSKDPNQPS